MNRLPTPVPLGGSSGTFATSAASAGRGTSAARAAGGQMDLLTAGVVALSAPGDGLTPSSWSLPRRFVGCLSALFPAVAVAGVTGCSAAFRKLMTWVPGSGAVPRPWVCPACGTTQTCTMAGEAAWNQRRSLVMLPATALALTCGLVAAQAAATPGWRTVATVSQPQLETALFGVAAAGSRHAWAVGFASSSAGIPFCQLSESS